jgi:hypothetical protein
MFHGEIKKIQHTDLLEKKPSKQRTIQPSVEQELYSKGKNVS